MSRLLRVAVALLCAAGLSASASTTSVTATLTDSDSSIWSSCTWTAVVSSSVPPTISGTPVPDAQLRASGVCSSTGILTSTMLNTSSVDQVGVTWTFTITPNAGPVAPSVISGVTTATANLTSVLSAGLVLPRFNPGTKAYGYADVEVNQPTLGDTYFNTDGVCGSTSLRQFSNAGWQCGGGGSTTNVITTPNLPLVNGVGPQALMLFNEGTGASTSFTDANGNSTSCPITGTVNTTYTWLPTGLWLNAGSIACPAASFNGAKYIAVWYRLKGQLGSNIFISGDAGQFTRIDGNYNFPASGAFYQPTGVGWTAGATDQTPGDASNHFIFGTNIQVFPNGAPATAMRWNATGYSTFACTTTCGLGRIPNLGDQTNTVFYAIVAYANAPTMAQIGVIEKNMRDYLGQRGLRFGTNVQYQKPVIANIGNSLTANFGQAFNYATSYPYFALQDLGLESILPYNYATASETLASTVTADLPKAIQQIQLFPGQSQMIYVGSCTNDLVLNSNTSTQCMTQETNAVTASHAAIPSIPIVLETVTPRGDATGPQNTQIAATNTAIISGFNAGTLTADSIADFAGDPILGYSGNNTEATHTYYKADGIHFTAAGNQIAGWRYAVAATLATKKNQQIWLPVNVPAAFSSLLTTATTTLTLPIYNIGPKQSVCGVKMQVTSAFVGSGISVLTASIGDSSGTATQYLAALNLLATGGSQTGPVAFSNVPGTINAVFTATGGNLSALTAGNLAVQVCLVATN